MRSGHAGWWVAMGVHRAFELVGVKRAGARDVRCLDSLFDGIRTTAAACKKEEILGYGDMWERKRPCLTNSLAYRNILVWCDPGARLSAIYSVVTDSACDSRR